jgi:tetratricopeptide (TPR) repeat protein
MAVGADWPRSATLPSGVQRAASSPARARAYAEGDRTNDAAGLLEEFAAADFELPYEQGWLTAMVGYAEAAIECRDPRYAGPMFDLLAPWADQLAGTPINFDGPVSHSVGALAAVLGRYDEADRYFTQAAAFNDRANAKFFAARTHLSWGKMRAVRDAPGDSEMARELLTKAHSAAAAHGYKNVERRAAEALRHLD